ncbi:alpha/beta hydrolase [Mucilaginibacter sp.]|uniref:alpha/beta hydrolase n=1 Tax=Mucilaginibacter sp. TaxID=1882438 RepID=UPI0035BC74D1
MKKLKQIVSQVRELGRQPTTPQLIEMLWRLICYPPKMPLRLHQEQLLSQAEKFTVGVHDQYFTNGLLTVNGFKWGSGKNSILITHGWGSKAADFAEMITALLELEDVEIIAFDAPACGSSEGELSNILLFVAAAKAVIQKFGPPYVVIGHSAGGLANVVTLNELAITPKLLISITPIILLHENFLKTMENAGVAEHSRKAFLDSFEERYGRPHQRLTCTTYTNSARSLTTGWLMTNMI